MKLLLTLILFFTTLIATAQNQLRKSELSSEFSRINDLIIVDSKIAKIQIDSLDKVYSSKKMQSKLDELSLNSIEYYRSMGDFAHMKHQLYNMLTNVSEKTSPRIKLGLDYYLALNQGYEGNKKLMLFSLQKTLYSARKNNYSFLEAQCLGSIGKHYLNIEQYVKGQNYIQKASVLFLSLKEFHSNSAIKLNQGMGYFWEGKTDLALKLFHEGLSYSKKHKLKKNHFQSLSNLAEAHLFGGNPDSAKMYYDNFLKGKDQADLRDVYQVYWGLEYFYQQKKNTDSAYHYSILMHGVDDSIRQNMEKELGNEIELKYYDDLNRKIIERKNREVKKHLKTNSLQWLVFLIIGIVLLGLLFGVIFSNRKKNKLNNLLSVQNLAIANKNSIIDAALKEKEVLLKEIHHRVKNNLQIISSLLNLQSKSITDQHAKDVLEEGKERIQAIALIHHRLYQTDDFSYILMEDYLPDLIHQLKKAYASDDCLIDTSVQMNNIKLSLDTSVPLGLIVCEMITNSFKHAFAGRTNGHLFIQLFQGSKTNSYELILEDDGVGLKNGLNFPQEGSMGAEIIQALTEQLNGKLKVEYSERGTKFNLKFEDIQSSI